jgi:ribonucleases P/MRP protein subunit RPP40
MDRVVFNRQKTESTNRGQQLRMGGCDQFGSRYLSLVPQGSVLGPLLFTIFINDLQDKIKNECRMYADDSKLIGVIEKEEDAIEIKKDIDSMANVI